jgi:hypothetical protein
VFDFGSTGLDQTKKSAVVNSLETVNPQRMRDGGPEESVREIKANSSAFFATQRRAVTREDYIVHVYALPEKFGRVSKVSVKQNQLTGKSMDVHVLSQDSDGHLVQASETLLSNIKTYLSPYRMLTDGVNLLQTSIINLGLDFGIVVSTKYNRSEILTRCISVLKDYFDLSNMQVGHPIVYSDITAKLQNVRGVISVYKLQFRNLLGDRGSGVSYSTTRFDVTANTMSGILYCPPDSIFEIKYPAKDIRGEAK